MAYSLKFINDDAYLFDETDIAMLTMDEEDSVDVDENDSEPKKLDNSNIIRNISFDQSEILHNIMHLYNNDEPFDCDMTASELKFYQKVSASSARVSAKAVVLGTAVFKSTDSWSVCSS